MSPKNCIRLKQPDFDGQPFLKSLLCCLKLFKDIVAPFITLLLIPKEQKLVHQYLSQIVSNDLKELLDVFFYPQWLHFVVKWLLDLIVYASDCNAFFPRRNGLRQASSLQQQRAAPRVELSVTLSSAAVSACQLASQPSARLTKRESAGPNLVSDPVVAYARQFHGLGWLLTALRRPQRVMPGRGNRRTKGRERGRGREGSSQCWHGGLFHHLSTKVPSVKKLR